MAKRGLIGGADQVLYDPLGPLGPDNKTVETAIKDLEALTPFDTTGTGLTKGYIRNVSNATNTTNCLAGVATVLPLIGNGTNNFSTATVGTGKLELDTTFNSNKGGIIVDQIGLDTDFLVRVSIVNLGGNATATVQCFLVFDKTIPGTGVAISSVDVSLKQDQEASVLINFFGNGIEAVYPRIISSVTRDFRINGFEVSARENQ